MAAPKPAKSGIEKTASDFKPHKVKDGEQLTRKDLATYVHAENLLSFYDEHGNLTDEEAAFAYIEKYNLTADLMQSELLAGLEGLDPDEQEAEAAKISAPTADAVFDVVSGIVRDRKMYRNAGDPSVTIKSVLTGLRAFQDSNGDIPEGSLDAFDKYLADARKRNKWAARVAYNFLFQ